MYDLGAPGAPALSRDRRVPGIGTPGQGRSHVAGTERAARTAVVQRA